MEEGQQTQSFDKGDSNPSNQVTPQMQIRKPVIQERIISQPETQSESPNQNQFSIKNKSYNFDEINIIQEVTDSNKPFIEKEFTQFEDNDAAQTLQVAPPDTKNASSKRSKYAKSNISSAIVPHNPEVTVQPPTPSKLTPQKTEDAKEKTAGKGKSKRMNYAKKTWASTPVDNMVNNTNERFSKVIPMQFDTGFMPPTLAMMGSSNRKSSPPPGAPDSKQESLSNFVI